MDFYLGVSRFNATDAARRAGVVGTDGYIRVAAHRLLTNDNVRAAIRERLQDRAMSSEEVLSRLAEQARGDIQDFVTIAPGANERDAWTRDLVSALKARDTGTARQLLSNEPQEPGWRFDLEKARELGVTHLIRKIGYARDGKPELELYDAQVALVQLGRHHGLFVDRGQIEHSGPGGNAIEVKAVDYRTAIAALAPGPVGDSVRPSQGEGAQHGPAVGEDGPGRGDQSGDGEPGG